MVWNFVYWKLSSRGRSSDFWDWLNSLSGSGTLVVHAVNEIGVRYLQCLAIRLGSLCHKVGIIVRGRRENARHVY